MTKFSIESSDRDHRRCRQALKDATIEPLGIAKADRGDPELRRSRGVRAAQAPGAGARAAGARVLMHASNFRPVKNVEMVVRIFAAVHERMDARS
jgi:hypothetical protein